MADKKDSNPIMDMFQNFGSSMNIPAPDLNSLMEQHQKNLQALQAAAKVGSDTSQDLMEKQRKALETALSDISDAVQEAQSGGVDPQAMVNSQMEMAKKSWEMTVQNATDMGLSVRQGSTEAFEILRARMMENIAELSGKKKS
ncbi:MAG: TIGR01841 family phasin [Sulfitobacter sp.]|nr:TIGR01841 family phasin [Sulfitobacter sp.]